MPPEIPPDIDVSKGIFVDRGTFGDVYLCTALNQVPVAVKQIRFKRNNKNEIEQKVRVEYELLKKLSHENIVQVYDFQEKCDQFLIIMEFVAGGTLSDYIKESKDGFLSEKETLNFTKQLLDGAHYMISNDVVNRDIKPTNVLLDCSGNNFAQPVLKIADFGSGRVLPSERPTDLSTQSGTCAYRAPETFRPDQDGNVSYGTRAEIWSVGMVMFEMLVGKCMFQGCSEYQVIYKLGNIEQQTDLIYDLPNQLYKGVQEFLANLLTVDKHSRPTAAEGLELMKQMEEQRCRDSEQQKTDLKLRMENSPMGIFIKTFTGQIISLRVDPMDTIQTVKKMLEILEDIPADKQRLIFGGKQLEDDRTFDDYNIESFCTIHCTLRMLGGDYRIIVKSMLGKNIITVYSSQVDTIADLKTKIRTQVSLPSDERLHVVHIGDQLHHLEDSYKIRREDESIFIEYLCLLHFYT